MRVSTTCHTCFVLYNEWRAAAGTTFASDGGFEVWKVKTYPVPPVISIVDTANPAGPVNAGNSNGFDITVSNTGPTATTTVTISDPLPAGTLTSTGH